MVNGILSEPAPFAGKRSGDVRGQIAEYLINKGFARRKTTYKMRDAVFARQRYWGEPIPIVHNPDKTLTPLPEKKLPLQLPNVSSYEPTGTGESPLASVKTWVKQGYETNTMPGWAGSSWYFLRYMDPHNKKAFAGEEALKYWKDVDMYLGGQEHATGHILYARFWHKFLYDLRLVPTKEPFKAWRIQGLILAEDGRKMSKRWGNVVNPDDIVKTYGADTLRLYEMFMGPFEATLPWSTESIIGSRRFVERVWRLKDRVQKEIKTSNAALRVLHRTIKKVTDDISAFAFNTAISAMMICTNEMEKAQVIHVQEYKLLLQILAPFAPHITEELWHQMGERKSIHHALWPTYNSKLLIDEEITIAVQVNGKVRAEITIPRDTREIEVEAAAMMHPRIKEFLGDQKPRRVIVIPNRIVNIVV